MTIITTLPTPPSRSDPVNFADRADAFLGALPTFGDQTNAVASEVNANAVSASASAVAAVGAANYKGDYSPSTTYQIGESVTYSGLTWISKTVNTGITPSAGANWLQLKTSAAPFEDTSVLSQIQATSLSF